MKVYAQWAWVCIAMHYLPPAGSPVASGCEIPPKRLGVKTRGVPSPGYSASRPRNDFGHQARRRAACPLPKLLRPVSQCEHTPSSRIPPSNPCVNYNHQGTIWRTACGAQRLHSLANTARLIIRPPTRRAGPRAGRRLKSHLSLRLYQRKIPTDLSGGCPPAGLPRRACSLGVGVRFPVAGPQLPVRVGPHTHPPTQKGIRVCGLIMRAPR